jgi:2-octaprenylphenol hydroxylase
VTVMERHEVIIVGGGIAGAAAACALGEAGVPVALIEARAPEVAEPPAQREARVYAITRASERIFRNLHAWDAIAAQQPCAFTDMEVWNAGSGGCLHFDCAELAEPCLGHIIEPRVMTDALLERLHVLDTVSVLQPASCRDVSIGNEDAQVTLEDGSRLGARLVVAADGANSPLRELLGIPVSRAEYHQASLVALVRTTQSHRDTAWQCFLPGGPLAFLPLGDGWCSIVWTLAEDDIERMLALPEEVFHAELAAAFEHRLGDISDSGPRAVWPLRRQHAERYVMPRAALIGDAAHVIHPLAGQGINLGLLDAAALAEIVVAARGKGRDPGSLHALRRYERWRRGDNLLMMSAMDGINRLFSNASPLLGRLRSDGLALVNQAAPLRHLFMRHAMGLGGDLPALAHAAQSDNVVS